MDDLLKSAQALAAAMEGQTFVATSWPVCARFRRAVAAATEEAAARDAAPAPAGVDAPAPEPPAPEPEARP